jgi:RpiR family carbohydrate utilization transcriptional regulator
MLDRIKASLPSLAPAEQRVGKLVLQDPVSYTHLTLPTKGRT